MFDKHGHSKHILNAIANVIRTFTTRLCARWEVADLTWSKTDKDTRSSRSCTMVYAHPRSDKGRSI